MKQTKPKSKINHLVKSACIAAILTALTTYAFLPGEGRFVNQAYAEDLGCSLSGFGECLDACHCVKCIIDPDSWLTPWCLAHVLWCSNPLNSVLLKCTLPACGLTGSCPGGD